MEWRHIFDHIGKRTRDILHELRESIKPDADAQGFRIITSAIKKLWKSSPVGKACVVTGIAICLTGLGSLSSGQRNAEQTNTFLPSSVAPEENNVLSDRGGPTFDASSRASIVDSATRVLEYVQESGDIGMQDKALFGLIFGKEILSITQKVIEQNEVNITPNEVDKRVVKAYNKHHNLKPMQIKEVFVKETIAEQEKEAAVARHERQREEKAQQEQIERLSREKEEATRECNKNLQSWLNNMSSADRELPGHGWIEIRSEGKKVSVYINSAKNGARPNVNEVIKADFQLKQTSLSVYLLTLDFHKS